MNELQKLCDKVPSFNNEDAMQVIQDELGAPWYEVGALFSCLTSCEHASSTVAHARAWLTLSILESKCMPFCGNVYFAAMHDVGACMCRSMLSCHLGR